LQGISDQALIKILTPMKENMERILGLSGNMTDKYARESDVLPGPGVPTIPGEGSGEPPVLPIPIITAEDITATGTYERIILSWNVPYDYWLAYYEILRSSTPLVGDAVVIGSTISMVYSDPVGPKKTYYYWIRIVQKTEAGGNVGALPAEGKEASTVDDPSHILDVLTGQITQTQLYQSLSERIDLIDAASSIPGSVNARDAALQTQITALAEIVDDLEGGGEYGAEAFLALEARVAVAESNITALSQEVTALESNVDNLGDDLDAQAVIVDSLGTRVTQAEGAVSAHAQSIQTLQTTVGGHTTSLQVHAASINGLYAEYMVKIDTDGKVVGFGLASGEPMPGDILLRDSCTSLDGWSVESSYGSGGSTTQVTFDEEACFLLDSGPTSAENFGWTRILRAFAAPDSQSFTIKLRIRHAALGSLGDNDHLRMEIRFGTGRAEIAFGTNGLCVEEEGIMYEVGTNLVQTGMWQNWEFRLDFSQSPPMMRVYLESALVGTVWCSYDYSTPNLEMMIMQRGYTTSSRRTYISEIDVFESDGPTTSAFIVRADKFAVCFPTGEGGAPVIPFIVGTVDGESTVGINGQLVVDGTIVGRAVAAHSITADHMLVERLSAISANMGNITAGAMNIGNGAFRIYENGNVDINAGTIKSVNYVPGVSGWRLTRTGALDITSLRCIGSANIKDAAVGTLQIAGDAVTVPVGSTATARLNFTAAGVYRSLLSVVLNSLGQPVMLHASIKYNVYVMDPGSFIYMARIRRSDGTTFFNSGTEKYVPPGWAGQSVYLAFSIYDPAPPSGNTTYTLEALVDDGVSRVWIGSTSSYSHVTHRSLSALGCKR